MSERDDGGPAFPVPIAATPGGDVYDGASGMTLRDWFAGQAISGILANPDISASAARLKVTTEEFREDTSRTAYQMADAMLAERSK